MDSLCRREEVDKQLVHAFSLVVMHPVRRVGQAPSRSSIPTSGSMLVVVMRTSVG
jgi:hypothetical protein